jgi:hypothetical protein
VSPPYDSGDITSLLACRSILDVLAVLVAEGKLGHRARWLPRRPGRRAGKGGDQVRTRRLQVSVRPATSGGARRRPGRGSGPRSRVPGQAGEAGPLGQTAFVSICR